MSNQDRLLSDSELEEAVENYHSKAYWAGRNETDFDSEDKLRDEFIRLINTQKRLYAESVIGEDEYVDPKKEANVYAYEVARNELRAEQRARIK